LNTSGGDRINVNTYLIFSTVSTYAKYVTVLVMNKNQWCTSTERRKGNAWYFLKKIEKLYEIVAR